MYMSRIHDAFDRGKALICYITGGDPSIEVNEKLILCMVEAGADIIEIGIPFSDPIAEGPVIQKANVRALTAGATLDRMLALAERLRQKTDVPLVFLTYLNPIFKYGYEAFFTRCEQIGVDGIIIPDLPFEEQSEIHSFTVKHGVDMISLVSPTSEKRIDAIAQNARGFVYIVSSLGVTGVRENIAKDFASMAERIKRIKEIPTAVGFGVSTPAQAKEIAKVADGVIVGSAIVRLIELYGEDADNHVFEYIKKMKCAISIANQPCSVGTYHG